MLAAWRHLMHKRINQQPDARGQGTEHCDGLQRTHYRDPGRAQAVHTGADDQDADHGESSKKVGWRRKRANGPQAGCERTRKPAKDLRRSRVRLDRRIQRSHEFTAAVAGQYVLLNPCRYSRPSRLFMFDKRTLNVTAVHSFPPAVICAAARKLGSPFASRRQPCMTWHGLLPPGLGLPLSTWSPLPSALRAKPRRAFQTQEGSSGFQRTGVALEAFPSRFRGL